MNVPFNELSNSQPSLCIPRLSLGKKDDISNIRNIFEKLKFGKIHHIDIIERKNDKGEHFKRAFIHFERWNTNEEINIIRQKLLSGKEIKIVFDNPWFWKVSANKCSIKY
jgi:hypothetical protein